MQRPSTAEEKRSAGAWRTSKSPKSPVPATSDLLVIRKREWREPAPRCGFVCTSGRMLSSQNSKLQPREPRDGDEPMWGSLHEKSPLENGEGARHTKEIPTLAVDVGLLGARCAPTFAALDAARRSICLDLQGRLHRASLQAAIPIAAKRLSGIRRMGCHKMLKIVGSHGLKGIVAKRRDPPYRSGRSPDWIKRSRTRMRQRQPR